MSALLSYAGWAFLPGLVTGWIQTIYYGIAIRAGDPKPQPGSPKHQKHKRRIHIAVIIVYLLYTLYEADYLVRQNGDFYRTLGVFPGADEKSIRSRFRRLAAIHHPDKVVPEDAVRHAAAEALFVSMKTAQDTLCDPVKRYAYDRFGPDMVQWQQCVTIRDYLWRGVQTSALPLYLGAACGLGFLSLVGYLNWGRFWRYFSVTALCVLEFHIITRPYPPAILEKVVNPFLVNLTSHPPLIPFQLLVLARKATFTLFIALSHIGGQIQQAAPATSGPTNAQEQQQLGRLEGIAKSQDTEATRLLAMEMAPFSGDEAATKDLRGRIREWLVNNTIRSDPEVRDAMGRALMKKRSGAPAGARN
ncbi:hypothetical protein MMC21_000609 [Puttea exsequens]|nr:hypothetical protein [Puttea exsequens]